MNDPSELRRGPDHDLVIVMPELPASWRRFGEICGSQHPQTKATNRRAGPHLIVFLVWCGRLLGPLHGLA